MIGHDIVVTVLSIGRDQVRLGIEAPGDIEVHREEVYRAIQQANRAAATSTSEDLGALVGVVDKRPKAEARSVSDATDATDAKDATDGVAGAGDEVKR